MTEKMEMKYPNSIAERTDLLIARINAIGIFDLKIRKTHIDTIQLRVGRVVIYCPFIDTYFNEDDERIYFESCDGGNVTINKKRKTIEVNIR